MAKTQADALNDLMIIRGTLADIRKQIEEISQMSDAMPQRDRQFLYSAVGPLGEARETVDKVINAILNRSGF
jgi:hypothetical protein